MLETTTPQTSSLSGIPRAIIHDLRTPLTSIRGYAQLLLRGVRSEEQAQRAHETIFREAERLARMLDQLSKVTEVTLDTSEARTVTFELGDIVRTAVDRARERWPSHHFSLEPGPPASVRADPRRVGEALAAVLDNAALYSEPGSRVDVAQQVEGARARVSVRDEGIGIPPDELDAIFECFQRGSNGAPGTGANARGLGIGLFLARAAATEAGGRIWAESEVAVRSTFHLELPLAAA